MTMDQPTVVYIVSLIGCAIGIAGFIVGIKSRAKNDGVLQQKLEQALKGIEDIKTDIKNSTAAQNSMALLVRSHDEKITILKEEMEDFKIQLNNTEARLTNFENISSLLKQILQNLNDRR